DASHRSPSLFSNGHGENRSRRVARLSIDRGIEAIVLRCICDSDGISGSSNPTRNASAEWKAKRGELWENGDARNQIALLGVDQPDRRALGRESFRDALARRCEKRIEIDLTIQQRRKIDEQREAIDH